MANEIKDQLLIEIDKTPNSVLKEVLDFLLFVRAKEIQQEQLEVSLLSELALAEDWLTPEEDEAWQQIQEPKPQKRRSGILQGTFVLPLPDSFDEPLEDFQEYMS
jgi:hypothetical protein